MRRPAAIARILGGTLVVLAAVAACGSASPQSTGVNANHPSSHRGSRSPHPHHSSPSPRASSPTPTPSSTAPSGPPTCSTADLRLSLGPGNGTAGSIYYPVVLTNVTTGSCELGGYPGVSFLSPAGREVGAPARRDASSPPHLVVLAPGQSASALLQWVEPANLPRSECHPAPSKWLRVYPPGQTASLRIKSYLSVCSTHEPNTVIGQVAAGKNGGVPS